MSDDQGPTDLPFRQPGAPERRVWPPIVLDASGSALTHEWKERAVCALIYRSDGCTDSSRLHALVSRDTFASYEQTVLWFHRRHGDELPPTYRDGHETRRVKAAGVTWTITTKLERGTAWFGLGQPLVIAPSGTRPLEEGAGAIVTGLWSLGDPPLTMPWRRPEGKPHPVEAFHISCPMCGERADIHPAAPLISEVMARAFERGEIVGPSAETLAELWRPEWRWLCTARIHGRTACTWRSEPVDADGDPLPTESEVNDGKPRGE